MIFQLLPVLLLLFTSTLSIEINYEEHEGPTLNTNYIVPAYTGSPRHGGVVHKFTFEDEPLRNDYSPEELEFINQLRSLSQNSKRGLISGSLTPTCSFANLTATCCINLDINWLKDVKTPTKTCVETGLRLPELTLFGTFYFNDIDLMEAEYHIGKVCWGLPPPLRKLSACLWVYHVEIDTKSRSFELCSLLELTKFVHLKFNCVNFRNGSFSMTDEYQPEDKGLINLSFVGGKPKLEVENPVAAASKWFENKFHNFAEIFRKNNKKSL